MPELPEVETIVRSIAPRLAGRRIVKVDLRRRDIVDPPEADLPAQLAGQRIHRIFRRGKRIIVTLENQCQFYIHLGMTGRLTLETPAAPTVPHTHFTADFDAFPDQLRFSDPRRFGGIWWLDTAPCDEGMGPEPLELRARQLARQLTGTTRAIKNALLDQSVIAGLGNIYVDESLFSSGIHPLTPANELNAKQIAALNRAIRATLRRAIKNKGSTLRDYRTADGLPGYFQKLHRVYDREGQACAKCRSAIQRIVIGGRSTHFCAKCQVLS